MGVDVTLECCSIPLEGHKGVFYHLSLHCLSIPAKHQLFKVNWCLSLSVDRLDSSKRRWNNTVIMNCYTGTCHLLNIYALYSPSHGQRKQGRQRLLYPEYILRYSLPGFFALPAWDSENTTRQERMGKASVHLLCSRLMMTGTWSWVLPVTFEIVYLRCQASRSGWSQWATAKVKKS